MTRIDKLRAMLGTSGPLENRDAFLVTSMVNIRYLTGFTGSAGFLVILSEDALLVVDGRYTVQARSETSVAVRERKGPAAVSLAEFLGSARNCAVEADSLTLAAFERLAQANSRSGVIFHPVHGVVEGFRLRKDEDEIAKLRRATELLETLMEKAISGVRAGRSEIEVAVEYEQAARIATARPLPFEPIIASGVRSALPHGVASTKIIGRGEFVVVDIGLNLDGYIADMTRTVAVGSADEWMKEIHEAVHLANQTAAKAIRPGLSGETAHGYAAAVLENAGLSAHFSHGLGHGLGLEVHEAPRLAPNVADVLETGMVFTIEPGVYFDGRGGVRIEDSGALLESGVELFNRLPRGLLIV